MKHDFIIDSLLKCLMEDKTVVDKAIAVEIENAAAVCCDSLSQHRQVVSE